MFIHTYTHIHTYTYIYKGPGLVAAMLEQQQNPTRRRSEPSRSRRA